MLLKSKIKLLVVHCSDTDNNEELLLDIHKMHIGFGWDSIGYHKIICRNGKIENGRPEYWIGAHVKGKNEISLGVCLVGRDNFTDKQFSSLEKVLKLWKFSYLNQRLWDTATQGKLKKLAQILMWKLGAKIKIYEYY